MRISLCSKKSKLLSLLLVFTFVLQITFSFSVTSFAVDDNTEVFVPQNVALESSVVSSLGQINDVIGTAKLNDGITNNARDSRYDSPSGDNNTEVTFTFTLDSTYVIGGVNIFQGWIGYDDINKAKVELGVTENGITTYTTVLDNQSLTSYDNATTEEAWGTKVSQTNLSFDAKQADIVKITFTRTTTSTRQFRFLEIEIMTGEVVVDDGNDSEDDPEFVSENVALESSVVSSLGEINSAIGTAKLNDGVTNNARDSRYDSPSGNNNTEVTFTFTLDNTYVIGGVNIFQGWIGYDDINKAKVELGVTENSITTYTTVLNNQSLTSYDNATIEQAWGTKVSETNLTFTPQMADMVKITFTRTTTSTRQFRFLEIEIMTGEIIADDDEETDEPIEVGDLKVDKTISNVLLGKSCETNIPELNHVLSSVKLTDGNLAGSESRFVAKADANTDDGKLIIEADLNEFYTLNKVIVYDKHDLYTNGEKFKLELGIDYGDKVNWKVIADSSLTKEATGDKRPSVFTFDETNATKIRFTFYTDASLLSNNQYEIVELEAYGYLNSLQKIDNLDNLSKNMDITSQSAIDNLENLIDANNLTILSSDALTEALEVTIDLTQVRLVNYIVINESVSANVGTAFDNCKVEIGSTKDNVTLWKEEYGDISLDTSSEDGIVKTYLDLGNAYADKVRITFDDSQSTYQDGFTLTDISVLGKATPYEFFVSVPSAKLVYPSDCDKLSDLSDSDSLKVNISPKYVSSQSFDALVIFTLYDKTTNKILALSMDEISLGENEDITLILNSKEGYKNAYASLVLLDKNNSYSPLTNKLEWR